MKFLFNIDGSSEVSCIDVCSLSLADLLYSYDTPIVVQSLNSSREREKKNLLFNFM